MSNAITNVNVESVNLDLTADIEWEVNFVSLEWDVTTDTTTFTYTVTSLAADQCESRPWRNGGSSCKKLSHWVLQADIDDYDMIECVHNCSTGKDGSIKDQDIVGYKWENDGADQLELGETQTYTITFDGKLEGGVGCAIVKGGTYYYQYCGLVVPGNVTVVQPGVYILDGYVYLDSDGDGVKDANEAGIEQVTVQLFDAQGNLIQTTSTDQDGLYTFINLGNGSYTVRVSRTQGYLSSQSGNYLSGESDRTVTIAGAHNHDSANDIGLTFDVDEMLDDFNSEDPDGDGFTFTGTGLTIGYWKHQLSVMIKGKGRSHYSADYIEHFLDYISVLAGSAVWDFSADQGSFVVRCGLAHAVLHKRTSEHVELLGKQLLGLEFNHVSSRGLDNTEFYYLQYLLIAHAEVIAEDAGGYWSAEAQREYVLSVKDLCEAINQSSHN